MNGKAIAQPVPSEQEIDRAARCLAEGRLAAFPTETVYGLGADAENPQAVARIYAAKGRPANHPVIVHIAPEGDVDYWAARVPPDVGEPAAGARLRVDGVDGTVLIVRPDRS